MARARTARPHRLALAALMHRARAALTCVLTLLPVAAQQQQQPPQPTFRAGVDVVAVDVHVVDGTGRPVPGLRPGDFAITVDGRPRPIVAADYVSYATSASATPAGPETARPDFTSNREGALPAEGRTILLVVDEENIRAGSAHTAARAAEQFLDRLQPADRVGLVVMPRTSAAIDPTTDRAHVKDALTRISGHLVSKNAQLDMIFALGVSEAFAKRHEPRKWAEITLRECSRRRAQKSCPDEMGTYAEAMIADVRQRGQNATRTIVSLMDALARLPGPKTLVYISEELPVSDYLAEQAEFHSLIRPLGPGAARARATFYVLQLDRSMEEVEDRYRNPSAREDADMRALGLETVTSVTGGRRMMVSGRVEAAFDRVALELSGYYLLGFRSEAADRDGRGHEIKVAVTRTGVEVRARKMFAYTADASAGDSSAAEAVNRVLRSAVTETGIPMSVATYGLMGPTAGAPQMRVLITAEIDRAVTREAPFTVGYTLTDGAGRNAGAIVERLTLKPAIGHPDGPLVYTAAALVPPGSYRLRMAAADDALRLGSVAHSFEARPTDSGTAQLSDLVVLDPYVAEAGKPRPSVLATAIGELTCYLEAYAGRQAIGTVTGRLELADATDSVPRASVPLDVQQADDSGRLRMSGSVPLEDVPPGDYVARAVFVTDGTAVARVVRRVRVGGGGVQAAPAPAPSFPSGGAPSPPAEPPAAGVARPAEPAPEAAPAPVSHTTPAVDVDELMPRVSAYIQRYAEQMSLVIGVERYAQWLQREDLGGGGGSGRAISRQLVAEFALVRVGNDWDGFRDVYEVDGKRVADAKDRMAKLFSESPAGAVEQSRKIAAESSRYNMGAVQRNFNVPTVALFFLSAANQGRFRFTKDKDARVSGVRVWKVKYEELKRPTIIRTSSGKDMPVKGEAWIDPVDGRVMKTHMQIDSEMPVTPTLRAGRRSSSGPWTVKTTASITVTYAVEPKLGILVPAEMLETYEAPMTYAVEAKEGIPLPVQMLGTPEDPRGSAITGGDVMIKVNCRATYSDFKRFETSARIVVPK